MAEKFCKDCKWMVRRWRAFWVPQCGNPATWDRAPVDPVTGKQPDPYIWLCSTERGALSNVKCGHTGKLWEPRS